MAKYLYKKKDCLGNYETASLDRKRQHLIYIEQVNFIGGKRKTKNTYTIINKNGVNKSFFCLV